MDGAPNLTKRLVIDQPIDVIARGESRVRLNPSAGRRCEKFGWRRPLRSARVAIIPKTHTLRCAPARRCQIFSHLRRRGLSRRRGIAPSELNSGAEFLNELLTQDTREELPRIYEQPLCLQGRVAAGRSCGYAILPDHVQIVRGVGCHEQLHLGLSLATGVVGWPSPPHGLSSDQQPLFLCSVGSARFLERRLRGPVLETDLPDQKAENA